MIIDNSETVLLDSTAAPAIRIDPALGRTYINMGRASRAPSRTIIWACTRSPRHAIYAERVAVSSHGMIRVRARFWIFRMWRRRSGLSSRATASGDAGNAENTFLSLPRLLLFPSAALEESSLSLILLDSQKELTPRIRKISAAAGAESDVRILCIASLVLCILRWIGRSESYQVGGIF